MSKRADKRLICSSMAPRADEAERRCGDERYTAGLKNRFLDNRLTVNVEGFYYDYRNFQVR